MKSFFQKKKSVKEDQEQRQRQADQKRIGDEIFEILREAGSKNTVYNLFQNGDKCEQLEPILVATIGNHDDNYMIGVGVPSPSTPSSNFVGIRGYSILHISIKLSRTGKELVYLCGDYNPEQQFSIQDIDNFKKSIVNHVVSFKLFN